MRITAGYDERCRADFYKHERVKALHAFTTQKASCWDVILSHFHPSVFGRQSLDETCSTQLSETFLPTTIGSFRRRHCVLSGKL
jgi:hypothetical protein